MRTKAATLAATLVVSALMCGCGGGNATFGGGGGGTPPAAPTISTSTQNGVQGGAVIVTLSAAAGSAIFYTVDGSAHVHRRSSTRRRFWWRQISRSMRLPYPAGPHAQAQHGHEPEFHAQHCLGNAGVERRVHTLPAHRRSPIRTIWTYDTGNGGCGNNELEDYCAWGSTTSPCSRRIPVSSWERTVICISWRSSLRPGSTRRRG